MIWHCPSMSIHHGIRHEHWHLPWTLASTVIGFYWHWHQHPLGLLDMNIHQNLTWILHLTLLVHPHDIRYEHWRPTSSSSSSTVHPPASTIDIDISIPHWFDGFWPWPDFWPWPFLMRYWCKCMVSNKRSSLRLLSMHTMAKRYVPTNRIKKEQQMKTCQERSCWERKSRCKFLLNQNPHLQTHSLCWYPARKEQIQATCTETHSQTNQDNQNTRFFSHNLLREPWQRMQWWW